MGSAMKSRDEDNLPYIRRTEYNISFIQQEYRRHRFP